ncbi:MAG TPA: MFS transporter [Alphaproteobacteria bacterium]|nr:MFS transporter [Alphaproteobacteria bacterium]
MLEALKSGGVAQALSHVNFRRFAIGDLVSLIGNWVQRVAVGWLTWELTESGTWLGIMALAELAPSILFAPLGGAFADKADRLKISIVTQGILMGQAAALAALTFSGLIEIWGLLILTGARGCLNAWSHPARQALVPSLVPQGNLAAAVALNSVLFNSARFLGPAVAGVIIAQWDVGHAFLFNTASFVAFLLVLIRLKVPFADTFERKRQSLVAQLSEGFRYLAGHSGIGPLMFMLLLNASLVRPVGDLLPGFSGAVFHEGATGLAWLTSAMGLGSMIAAFSIAQRGHVAGLTRLAVANMLFAALGLVVFSFVPVFMVAVAVLAVVSFAMTITGISCQSLVQNAVEGEFRGRVISVYGVIFRAAPAIGALIIGACSEVFGWHWPMAVSAMLCILAWAWGRRRQAKMAEALEI